MQKNTKAFRENLSIICDELHLAKIWGRESILITAHKSIQSQEKLKKALYKDLAGLEYKVFEIEINKIKGNFIKYILDHKNIEDNVFIISGIGWGGGEDERDGYRILNLHRETFVEQKIKAVFLLTIQEASNLPNYAPDFWAFRHRLLEFASPRSSNKQCPATGLMMWHKEKSKSSDDNVYNKTIDIQRMLAELPRQVESSSLRAELLYELGYYFWRLGELNIARENLVNSLELAKIYHFTDQVVKCQNGLAIIFFEQENYDNAKELLEFALEENPRDCFLHLNLAVTLFATGKRYRAKIKCEKAVKLCAQDPWVWNSSGFLYLLAGNMDEAESCFRRAVSVSSRNSYFFESLAFCYQTMELYEKANATLEQAQNDSSNRSIIQEVLNEVIEGNAEKTSAILENALIAGKLTELDIVRDPILGIISIPFEIS